MAPANPPKKRSLLVVALAAFLLGCLLLAGLFGDAFGDNVSGLVTAATVGLIVGSAILLVMTFLRRPQR